MQLNIYIPEGLRAMIQKEAKKEKASVSKYLVSFLEKHLEHPKKWSPSFFAQTSGKWQGDFPAIERTPPEEIETL